MKRFIAVAAACLAAVAIYAVTASGGPQAVTPKQFAALSKKVTTLSKTVNTLKRELAGVETCALYQAISVAQFGNPPTEGYVYENADTSLEPVTALDVSVPSAAQAWMLITSPECASIINSGKKKAASFRAHVK